MDTLEVTTSNQHIINTAANGGIEDNLANMSSDEDDAVRLVNKRKKFFSNNSSDEEYLNTNINSSLVNSNDNNNSNDESERPTRVHKSRIKNNCTSSDSDEDVEKKNVAKFYRKNKFREKFDKFKAEKRKSQSKVEVQKISKDELLLYKENTQEASPHITLSVCDPDESEEEENSITEIKKIIGSKSSISVKSNRVRMSAKEAIANMQKIKSESNRMLREKEVSLPYHRPKALSLKDIMNRRRPAVSSDGKSLPIKMNDEQLKHYAMMLEERQKEMMELCKSDSDEEDDPSNKEDIPNTEDIAEQNDMSFDQIVNISYNNQSGIQEESTVQSEEKETIDQNILDNSNEKEIDEVEHTSDMKEHSEADNTNIKNNTDFKTQTCDQMETNNLVQQNKNRENLLSNGESQSIICNYNSENIDMEKICIEINKDTKDKLKDKSDVTNIDAFSDSDLDYDDLDALIENAEILKDDGKENSIINSKPKLTGAPGTIISLDDDNLMVKPTGIELLKERFTYFANLQKQADIEKDREKQYKPGTQHIKLRQQLEEEIAEQRSLEWSKRLEEEKLLKSEQKDILGEDSFDDIDKIEAKLERLEEINSDDDGGDGDDEGDEDGDLIEDDIDMTDKPIKRNPMLDDEAEESDNEKDSDGIVDEENAANDDEEDEDNESESDTEDELDQTKPKKGRILKAFEDSDDENATEDKTQGEIVNKAVQSGEKMSQDDELQLAQANKSLSYDLFTSQGSCDVDTVSKNIEGISSEELGTFSILNTNSIEDKCDGPIPVICETQKDNANLDDIVGLCSGSFSQSIIVPNQKSQLTPSEFGDDVIDLCTGKFYDNQFVSQTHENDFTQAECLDTESLSIPKTLVPIANLDTENAPSTISNIDATNTEHLNIEINSSEKENTQIDLVHKEELKDTEERKKKSEEKLLRSILDELDEPEFDKPKQYKFFTSNDTVKKKLVIDSDDEIDEEKKDKKKKRKRKQIRALQISDDEEDEEMQSDDEECESDDGDDDKKVYEYDSEENEVEVERPKKKRMGEFFEKEAELTSEDEWAGSGDEDEVGLDRMEREAGDDDVFHEGKLQSELGQIHMREVLDQDKREVRLIQELLFEDADLGDGHRQRKFRWRNVDGEEESGAIPDEHDTQEEEFESEEIWRKQRHEREMFLKKMQESGEESHNTSINRTTLIKANLSSRAISKLIVESKESPVEKECIEEKRTKDIPSPKKPFAIFKQNYHGSFLTRGRGALARLAALATPLVVDDDTPKVLASARGNFIFATRTQEKQKVNKRKADTSVITPQLIKKLKTEEYKKTLFEQLRD